MLQFITHSTDDISTIESAKIALEGGCKWIQLRMKKASKADILKNALILKEICNKYNATFIIDDEVEICKEVQADGVHLGKEDMDPVEARKILGDSYIIGGTANTFEDLKNLYNKGVDYIGLGPFRFTTTKEKLSPFLGLDGYKEISHKCKLENINIPIVAIGGITIEDIPAILETGIPGIALSSTILQSENPVNQTKKILEIVKE